MKNELLGLLKSYPTEVKWSAVFDFDNFDDRLFAVDILVVNTIGVSEGYIEFCPDNDPPLREEILCWIWAIRPDLSNELIKLDDLSEELKVLFNAYINSDMDIFWDYMG